MNNIILHNFDLDKLSFKKPERITDKISVFDVKYNCKQQFIIQSPKLLIPNVPMVYSHNNIKFYKLKVVAHDYSFQKKTKEFIEKLENIDTFIKNKIKDFYSRLKRKKSNNKFINTTNHYNNKVYLYFNIQFYNNKPIVNIYDWDKNQKDFNYLIEQSMAYSLLWLKNIWIKNNKIGLNWVILQMKVYPPIYKIDECLIIDDDEIINKEMKEIKEIKENLENNPNTYKNHETYSKYFKMKRLRIPIASIQQKMRLENIDPTIILKDADDIVSELVKHPIIKSNHLVGLTNVKLRHTTDLEQKQKPKYIDSLRSDSKTRPPTLLEILNTKNNLKKIRV